MIRFLRSAWIWAATTALVLSGSRCWARSGCLTSSRAGCERDAGSAGSGAPWPRVNPWRIHISGARKREREPGVRHRQQSSVPGRYPGDFALEAGYEMARQGGVVPVACAGLDAPHGRGRADRPIRPAQGCESDVAVCAIPAPAMFGCFLSRRNPVARRAGPAVQRGSFPVGHSRASPHIAAGGGRLRSGSATKLVDLWRTQDIHLRILEAVSVDGWNIKQVSALRDAVRQRIVDELDRLRGH